MNIKLTEMQAAFGREQIKRVDGFIEARRKNYKAFADAIGRETNPELSPFCFPILSPNKTEVVKKLEERGIQTRNMFTGNILEHPAFKDIGCRVVGDLPVSNRLFHEAFF